MYNIKSKIIQNEKTRKCNLFPIDEPDAFNNREAP